MIELPGNMNDDQLQEVSKVASLISAFIQQRLDRPGHEELDAWVSKDRKNMLLFEELTSERNRKEALQWMKELQTKAALKKVKQKIVFNEKPIARFKIWHYGAAAALLIVIALVGQTLYTRSLKPTNDPSKLVNPSTGKNKATLTLDDGSQMVLSDMRSGVLKNEHGVLIDKKNDGTLVYNPGESSGDQEVAAHNILTTPRGGEYMITLSDGSRVWLNANSSLRYDVLFNNKVRKVSLSGEAYFEIAKDATRPFIVAFNNSNEVQVVGTRFDITTYDDDEFIVTTLVEGLVMLNQSINLKPREQYLIERATGKGELKTNVDLEEALAWKDGQFNFKNTPIRTIMRELARWYDIDVNYEGSMANTDFTGSFARKDNINTILTRLEKTGIIHFKREGKKVTVSK